MLFFNHISLLLDQCYSQFRPKMAKRIFLLFEARAIPASFNYIFFTVSN